MDKAAQLQQFPPPYRTLWISALMAGEIEERENSLFSEIQLFTSGNCLILQMIYKEAKLQTIKKRNVICLKTRTFICIWTKITWPKTRTAATYSGVGFGVRIHMEGTRCRLPAVPVFWRWKRAGMVTAMVASFSKRVLEGKQELGSRVMRAKDSGRPPCQRGI